MAKSLPVVKPGVRKGFLFLLPAVSALLISAAYPPFDVEMLAWIGLAPFFYALRRTGPVAGAGLSFMYGLLFVFGVFGWAINVSEISLPSFFIWLIPFSLYFLVFGVLYRLFSRNIGSWILIGAPALWVTLEYVRSNLFFLAWPWNLLGHSQYLYLPVIQIADIAGVYGISFLMVMVNQVLSRLPELLLLRNKTSDNLPVESNNWTVQLLLVVLALEIVLSYGWYRLGSPESNKRLRVALVQGNRLVEDNMPYADRVEHLGVYEKLSRNAAQKKPNLIVWPAASLPAPISSSRLVRYAVVQLARETGSYLLVGGAGFEKLKPKKEGYRAYSNSEFLISPSGRLEGQYNKIKLVPFNEYLPLQGKIKWPRWITILEESFIPGKEFVLFEMNGAKFGTPICWENMFPDIFRRFVKDGANFMVSSTNEGYLGRTAGPYQTLATNIFRAVENRVAIARANSTGVSAFINRNGKIVERVQDSSGKDLFVSGFLVRDVPLSNKKTFYTVYGDVFAYVMMGITLLSVMASIVAYRSSGYRSRI